MDNPEIEPAHRHHTGRPRLDLVLGISAVSISLMSLFLAIQNDRAMEHLVQANSWPRVQIIFATSNPDGSPHAHMDIANKGVGPATVESLELSYRGKRLSGPRAVLDALLNRTTDPKQHHVLIADVAGIVLSAKETVSFLDFVPAQQYSAEDYAAISDGLGKLDFKTCYCSVFDECWILDSNLPRPSSVKACPVEQRRSE